MNQLRHEHNSSVCVLRRGGGVVQFNTKIITDGEDGKFVTVWPRRLEVYDHQNCGCSMNQCVHDQLFVAYFKKHADYMRLFEKQPSVPLLQYLKNKCIAQNTMQIAADAVEGTRVNVHSAHVCCVDVVLVHDNLPPATRGVAFNNKHRVFFMFKREHEQLRTCVVLNKDFSAPSAEDVHAWSSFCCPDNPDHRLSRSDAESSLLLFEC